MIWSALQKYSTMLIQFISGIVLARLLTPYDYGCIKDGLSEDNEKDAELELQKLHDKYIKKLDDLLAAKNKEIMTV